MRPLPMMRRSEIVFLCNESAHYPLVESVVGSKTNYIDRSYLARQYQQCSLGLSGI